VGPNTGTDFIEEAMPIRPLPQDVSHDLQTPSHSVWAASPSPSSRDASAASGASFLVLEDDYIHVDSDDDEDDDEDDWEEI